MITRAKYKKRKADNRAKRVLPKLNLNREVAVEGYCVRPSSRGKRSTKKETRRKRKDKCNKEFTKTDVRDIIKRYKNKHGL